jgi:hypothetical protein
LPRIVIDRQVPLDRHGITTEKCSLNEERYRTCRMAWRVENLHLIFFRSIDIDHIAISKLVFQVYRTPNQG